MKKLLIPGLLSLITNTLSAQFNNEWIDYSKTYYKIKIAQDGLYRLTQGALTAANLGNTPAQDFQLWHNGSQVAVYTSVASGPLGSTGYIEFFGEKNDGKIDRALYLNPKNHLTDRTSLFTDTAIYFLTVNSASLNRRYTNSANDLTGTLPAPASYLSVVARHDYNNRANGRPYVNKGYYLDYGDPVYSSAYDAGEMMSSDDIFPDQNATDDQTNRRAVFNNLMPYTAGGVTAQLRISLANSGYQSDTRFSRERDVRITLNTNQVADRQLTNMEARLDTISSISPTLLQQPITTLGIKNFGKTVSGANPVSLFDRIVAGFVEIDYPRLPDAGGLKTLRFYLPATGADTYLEITNLAHGGVAPVLYNLTGGERIVAELSATGVVRIKLPASEIKREYLLASQSDGSYGNINVLTTRNFIDYNQASLQGDYIIISNQRLFSGSPTTNGVELYKTYRSSAAGGGYNAQIYDIEQLVDQFAFGVKMHPFSVKNFLRFTRQNYTTKPKFCLLIGKGVTYNEFREQENNPQALNLELVPTFGWPASDNLLASDDLTALPATLIGRLNVITSAEVIDYLDKLKEYETTQASGSQTQMDKLWMKNAVHVVGANDPGTANLITPYMNNYKRILQDTLFGANVTTFNKFNTTTASTIENEQLSNLFQNGFSLLTYFGHSSATKLDYNLDDPSAYNNPGKYPNFLLLGCSAGNFFDFDQPRLQTKSTISEKYILAKNRGSVAVVAGTSLGVVNGLGSYATGFYNSLSGPAYGKSIGQNIYDAVRHTYQQYGVNSYTARFTTEQQTLHGDPALKINASAKPDYAIETQNVFINPTFISIAENSFKVKIYHYNLGKAIKDSITVLVRRQYPNTDLNPNGLTDTIYFQKIKAPLFNDSLELELQVLPERDKGTNKILVSLETENRIDELSEANNSISTDVVIFENDLRPIYPYNFAIVNKQGTKLVASTSNPFSLSQLYQMELDTTTFFDSPFKVTKTSTNTGGVIEFDPGITYQDSTVYYWRLGVVPATGTPDRWNNSSFVYLNGTEAGFNQSHFYQHTKSIGDRIHIDSTSRKWTFNPSVNTLSVTNSTYGEASYTDDGSLSVFVNSKTITSSLCTGYSTIFNVFDPVTFKPMLNYPGYLYGSGRNDCDAIGRSRQYNFEYDDRTLENRQKMAAFMDIIPEGSFVVVRKYISDNPIGSHDYSQNAYASTLKADGPNSFYTRMIDAGFADLDSFNRPRTYIFVYKKGDKSFEPVWTLSNGLSDRADLNVSCIVSDTLGYISSPTFGPAKSWKTALWRGNTPDGKTGDLAQVDLIGLNAAGDETKLYSLNANQQDFDISQVNAATYPYMKLRMRNADSINGTPYNLRWWRLYYAPVPEGALAGNISLQTKDSLNPGESLVFKIAFKNISETAFADSLNLMVYVTDKTNTKHFITVPKTKVLVAGDTAMLSVTLDTKDFPGINTLYVAVNPDGTGYQPEQFFFNNFLYKNFYVREDKYNPLLDVTFDGIHILNKDIVSAKPHIQMKLKDENRFLGLTDTAGLTVQLLFPGETTPRTYAWGDKLMLTPPTDPTTDNTATIDFTPILDEDTEGSDYEMTVSGKDRAGNKAGSLDYRISFQVFNKPMISNLLNFPNPFSTSTAFVFTITGSEIPQEFKIQILTITGKIVREITKQELGELHIGTNITEFKWDGTDTYGSKLANGVYLYRVVSSLDGKKMDKFRLNDGYDQNKLDDTDKYFRKGYGKMVILR